MTPGRGHLPNYSANLMRKSAANSTMKGKEDGGDEYGIRQPLYKTN